MSFMQTLSITFTSMSIVFLILFLISFILESFKYIFKEKPKTELKNGIDNQVGLSEEIEEEEKVVIALATSIIAGEGKINPNLQIKKITRIK
ncbi:OadG family protein [Romboutsia sp.]|uniref:OadG family protein n=1 Tax=Romboutsia sp. TaxID=1965302 RepID=UPI003F3E5A4A